MANYFPCPFNIVVPGNSIGNLSSFPLLTAKRIVEILMTFPSGTNLNFGYRFYLLPGPPNNTTSLPSGSEIVAPFIIPGIFAGDGVTYTVPFSIPIIPPNTILCMAAINNTATAFTAEAIAILAG
jgi:hypothetical protein